MPSSRGKQKAPCRSALAASAARLKSLGPRQVGDPHRLAGAVGAPHQALIASVSGFHRVLRVLNQEFLDFGAVDAPVLVTPQHAGVLVLRPARAAMPLERHADGPDDPGDGLGQRLRSSQHSRDRVFHGAALLGLLALGNVYDGTDQSGDPAAGAGVGGLVVNGVAACAVGRRDRGFVGLRSRTFPQHLIAGMEPVGGILVVRVEVVNCLADECFAGYPEETLPCLVDAEITPVGAFEEDRGRQRFDQFLGNAPRLGVLTRGRERAHQPEEEHADGDAPQQHDPGQEVVGRVEEIMLRRGELQLPQASADLERHRLPERDNCLLLRRTVEQQRVCSVCALRRVPFAEVDYAQLQGLHRVLPYDVVYQFTHEKYGADDAREGSAPLFHRVGGHAGAVHRQAQADTPYVLQGNGHQRDPSGCAHGSGVTSAADGRSAHRVRGQIEPQPRLVAFERLGVDQHDVVRAFAWRLHVEF